MRYTSDKKDGLKNIVSAIGDSSNNKLVYFFGAAGGISLFFAYVSVTYPHYFTEFSVNMSSFYFCPDV